jgi:hypothetical protein
MDKPDFICTDLYPLKNSELIFLLNHFPQLKGEPEQVANLLLDMPSTLESLLSSQYVVGSILKQNALLLDISPFLLFSVLLRQELPNHRSSLDRQVVNYLANLLSLFVQNGRVNRVARQDETNYEYIVDLLAAANQADAIMRFQIHAHIANYALFLSGLFHEWLAHRHRYHKSLMSVNVYRDYARTYYYEAANNPWASKYQIHQVFRRIAQSYDTYVAALNRISRQYMQ